MNKDIHFSLPTDQGYYEFSLKSEPSQSSSSEIAIGSNRYSLQSKNPSDLPAIERILKEALASHPQSIEEFSHNLTQLSSSSSLKSEPIEKSHQVGLSTLLGTDGTSLKTKVTQSIRSLLAPSEDSGSRRILSFHFSPKSKTNVMY